MKAIAALLDDALARGLGSAAAVSIGDRGVEVERLLRGHTRRVPDQGEPIDDRTWFDVASLTKPIATVTSLMVLVGEGKLALEDPVRRWLPDAASTGTVRQLLGHSAGCAWHVEFFKTLRAGNFEDPRRTLVELATREPVASPPGVSAVYSDLGFIMLGAIIERVAGMPLEDAVRELVAEPLGLGIRYATASPVRHAVATELDDRGLVCGRVHDENAYYGGGACGHAGVFARVADVARFAAAIVETFGGTPRGRLRSDVVTRFLSEESLPGSTWRLGWDTPSTTPGISQAGDRWPRTSAVGHTGFTGTSLWLDLPNRRWVALLTNRVHPTRHNKTADAIKVLRRTVNDTALELFDTR